MYYSSKRQAFLVDQGYAFKVITQLNGMDRMPNLAYNNHQERMNLLTDVLLATEEEMGVESIQDDLFSDRNVSKNQKKKGSGVRRQAGTLSSLAGGDSMAYMEYAKGSRNKELARPRNAFFRKEDRNRERRQKAAREAER